MDNLTNFLISFAASSVAIVVVLYIERQRRPRLRFRVLQPTIVPACDPLRRQCTWLQIEVTNIPCAHWIAWVYTREAALACRAYLSFYSACGNPLFQEEMPARWSGTVEPHPEIVEVNGVRAAYLRDALPSVDIHANHTEPIHPIIVFPQPLCAFGWTNESYLHEWRHPRWAIPHDLFIVRLRITTADRDFVSCYRIDLTSGYDSVSITHLDSEFDSSYTQFL